MIPYCVDGIPRGVARAEVPGLEIESLQSGVDQGLCIVGKLDFTAVPNRVPSMYGKRQHVSILPPRGPSEITSG